MFDRVYPERQAEQRCGDIWVRHPGMLGRQKPNESWWLRGQAVQRPSSCVEVRQRLLTRGNRSRKMVCVPIELWNMVILIIKIQLFFTHSSVFSSD